MVNTSELYKRKNTQYHEHNDIVFIKMTIISSVYC